jgi:hypothetical protein
MEEFQIVTGTTIEGNALATKSASWVCIGSIGDMPYKPLKI